MDVLGTLQPPNHIPVRNRRCGKAGCRTGEDLGQGYQFHEEKPENFFTKKGSQLN